MKRSKSSPSIFGLVEVENAKVVVDLANSSYLRGQHYGFLRHTSTDDREIDLALLYDKIAFELLTSKTDPVFLKYDEGELDYTRNILKVNGNLHGELLPILVNHWHYRREVRIST